MLRNYQPNSSRTRLPRLTFLYLLSAGRSQATYNKYTVNKVEYILKSINRNYSFKDLFRTALDYNEFIINNNTRSVQACDPIFDQQLVKCSCSTGLYVNYTVMRRVKAS